MEEIQSSLYVQTALFAKFYSKTSEPPKNGRIVTYYNIALTSDQIRRSKDELSKYEGAIKKYYLGHKRVESCTLESQENDGFYVVKVSVQFAGSVLGLLNMNECENKMEFLEQLATHLRDLQFETSKDPNDRRIAEMVNVIDARQIVLCPDEEPLKQQNSLQTPLKNIASSQDEVKDVDSARIILTNFIFPGTFNQMAQMTDVPSVFTPDDDSMSNKDFSNSEFSRTERDLGMLGGSRKCVSASLEYLGIISPEQLKFRKQDSLALVWQLGVLLYRIAFDNSHPFLSCLISSDSEVRENTVRSAGFITQTRRNILLIRYKKTTGNDLKSHKLQQILDKVFCIPLSRLNLDQFITEITGKGLGYLYQTKSAGQPQRNKKRPAQLSMDDNEDLADFNPQVQILHQSASSDEGINSQKRRLKTGLKTENISSHLSSKQTVTEDIRAISARSRQINKSPSNISPISRKDGKQSPRTYKRVGETLPAYDLMAANEVRFTEEDIVSVTASKANLGVSQRIDQSLQDISKKEMDLTQNFSQTAKEGRGSIKQGKPIGLNHLTMANLANLESVTKQKGPGFELHSAQVQQNQDLSSPGRHKYSDRGLGDSPIAFQDNELDVEELGSISQRMELLNSSKSIASQSYKSNSVKRMKNMDFYQQNALKEEHKGNQRPLHTEDDVAHQINLKKERVDEPNGFDNMQDFDDLPSVKSKDLISQVDDISDAQNQQKLRQLGSRQEFISTPRNNRLEQNLSTPKVIHKATPIIEKKEHEIFQKSEQSNKVRSSQVSLGSEQASLIGDIEDQIGFVLCLDQEQAVGITIVSCQFLYFNYAKQKAGKPRKLSIVTPRGEPVDQVPQNVMQVIEVQNRESRSVTFVVVASEFYLDIFALDIGGGVPAVVHQKKLRIQANSICSNLEEPNSFYIATKNQVGFAIIDIGSEQKVSLGQEKIKFSNDRGDKTTALRHTFLKADTITMSTDSYLAIAFKTADEEHFNLAIYKRTASEDEIEPFTQVVLVQDCHTREVTQILALTDYYRRLSFVTMSLDGYIKILTDEGIVENTILSMGMALNGSIMPNRQDYYLVSILNEETEENYVCVYRRQKMKRALGPFADQVLDLKMSALGNMMFIPSELFSLQRIELKDL